jgi:hypothetical protein
MIQAGLSQTTRTCGQASCVCHADPSRRHGPNAYLTYRSAEGKSTSLYVPSVHLEEAVAAKNAWDAFWTTATALASINREELKQSWRAAAKARAKR